MNFNKDKLHLIDYFLKQEKYNIYKIKKQNNNVYLYKINNRKFQIIKIVNNFNDEFDIKNSTINDEIIEMLKIFLNKKFQLIKINILSIILIKNYSQIYENNNGDVMLFVNKNNYINKLSNYYPNIIKLKENNKNNISMLGVKTENIFNGIKEHNNKLKKNLKQLNIKLNINNIYITWILIILLIFIPVVEIFFGDQIFNTKRLNEKVIQLIYGGVNRDLLIWNNQWWRLWTYVLFSNNPLLIILNLYMIFNVSYYNEVILGRLKLLIILIIGIPLSGLFLSVILPNQIFGGSTILLAILWGSLFSYNYGKEDLENIITNQKTLIVVFWLLIMPFFLGYLFYLINFVGFFIGSAIGYGLEFNCLNRINWTILYPFFIILTIIILIIITILLINYIPPYNENVINTLISYWHFGLIKKNIIENMLKNYYFYNKENWPIFLLQNYINFNNIFY